jgi:hypothetical protein
MRDPATGKPLTKSFAVKKYGIDNCRVYAREWKKSIKEGRTPYIPPEPEDRDDMYVPSQHNPALNSSTIPEGSRLNPPPWGLGGTSPEEPKHIFERKEFSLNLPDDKFGVSFLLLGSTRSGKSTLMNYIYENYFKDYITTLHTNSLQSEIYKPLKKKAITLPSYYPEMIKDTFKINKETKNKYRFLHIIDDVVNKKNDPTLIQLFTIMRNSRINGIITGQELTIFNSIARTNINFVVLMKLNSDMAIEKVIKSYLRSYFPADYNLNQMIRAYKKLTDDHNFIVIDNINGGIFLSRLNVAN